jgi:hypothetical protein
MHMKVMRKDRSPAAEAREMIRGCRGSVISIPGFRQRVKVS